MRADRRRGVRSSHHPGAGPAGAETLHRTRLHHHQPTNRSCGLLASAPPGGRAQHRPCPGPVGQCRTRTHRAPRRLRGGRVVVTTAGRNRTATARGSVLASSEGKMAPPRTPTEEQGLANQRTRSARLWSMRTAMRTGTLLSPLGFPLLLLEEQLDGPETQTLTTPRRPPAPTTRPGSRALGQKVVIIQLYPTARSPGSPLLLWTTLDDLGRFWAQGQMLAGPEGRWAPKDELACGGGGSERRAKPAPTCAGCSDGSRVRWVKGQSPGDAGETWKTDLPG